MGLRDVTPQAAITRVVRPWLYSREYADLATALAAADAGAVRRVVMRGAYSLSSTLTLPDGCELEGDARTGAELIVPAGTTFPAIGITGATGGAVRNLGISKASGAAASSRGYGVWIHGNAADVLVENVTGTELVSTVQVGYGPTGASDGLCERITLRRVTGNGSPSLWGIGLDDVDVALLDDCHARANWLDGFKLRKNTRNVTIRGGSATGNGLSGVGDGLDAYAGGHTFLIDGTTFANNASQGATIKTGDLHKTEAADYGYIQNVQVRGVRCVGNSGTGLYLTLNDPADTAEPVPNAVSIDGGIFDDNAVNGLYLNAANVVVDAPIVRRNGQHGLITSTRAFQVEINNALVVANGQSAAGSYDGASINGSYIRINGGQYIGVDSETLAIESDQAALTRYHRYNIEIGSTANEIEINWPACRYSVSHGVHDSAATGVAVINQRRAGLPTTTGTYGSLGSLYVRDYSSIGTDGYETLWAKTAGGRNTPSSGWTRLVQFAPVSSLPTAASALRGLTLRVEGGAGVADGVYQCLKKSDDTYAWFNLLTGAEVP